MSRKLISTVLAAAVSAALVISGVATPAYASEDKGLCSENHDRVTIPGDFPLAACFDGSTLVVKNETDIPVTLTLRGNTTKTPERFQRGGAGAGSLLLNFIKPGDFGKQPEINAPDYRAGLVPPGYYVSVNIGHDETKVNVASSDVDVQKDYLIAELLDKFVPGGDAPRAVVQLIRELHDVTDQNEACHQRETGWGDAGCSALLGRNVVFAFGRAGISVAGKVVQSIASALDTTKWADSAVKDATKLKGTHSFTIAAYQPPVTAPKSDPKPAPATNQGNGDTPSGGGSNSSGNGSGGNDNPPAPQGGAVTVLATVQNMHLAGASGLEEDSGPVYLSTSPQPRCAANGCKIDGTDMLSGYQFTGICWVTGAMMTNENRNTPVDDNNPNRIDTDRWLRGAYGGRIGLISYIYITPETRNMNIAPC